MKPTKLCTHNEDVDITNASELSSLPGQLYRFTAQDSEPTMSKQLDTLCPAPECIELKVGAQVSVSEQQFCLSGGEGGAHIPCSA